MRKQESVHLHALLVAVAEEFENSPEVRSPDRSTYRDLGVSPSSIHRSKADHEEALLLLARAIGRSLREQPTPGQQ